MWVRQQLRQLEELHLLPRRRSLSPPPLFHNRSWDKHKDKPKNKDKDVSSSTYLMCLSSQQAAADVGEEDYPSLIKVNISHHSPDRMNLKHIGYRSIMGTRDVVCFNLICLFQWLNIKYLFQWLNINGLFQWLNIKFLFQWLNIECFFQWFDIKCLLQCLNIKCPIQCLNIKCLFEWLNIKCLFQWLNDSMTRCLFQELWRQFLEEKEGPSEAAAAAPVQVWLKKYVFDATKQMNLSGNKRGIHVAQKNICILVSMMTNRLRENFSHWLNFTHGTPLGSEHIETDKQIRLKFYQCVNLSMCPSVNC